MIHKNVFEKKHLLTFSWCFWHQLELWSSHILDYEHWVWSWSRFLGSQPPGDLVINPVVSCRYFPVSTRPAVTFPVLLAGTQLHWLVSGARGTQV